MSGTHWRIPLVLLMVMTLLLAACGAPTAPAGTTTEPTAAEQGGEATGGDEAAGGDQAAEQTVVPTAAQEAVEGALTTPEATIATDEGATEAATETDAAAEEATATEGEGEGAAEEATPAPTLTPAPDAVVLEYWEMDWGLTEPLQALVNDFNRQNPEIYVKMTQLEWGDYTQKLLGAIGAGTPPDVSGGDSGLPFNFAAQEQAMELDELYNEFKSDGRFEDLTQWAQEKWNYNGHYVGVSWQIDPRAIYYRTDMFEEAGIEPPTTHDELLAAAQELTDPSKEQYGICVPGKQGSYDTDQFYMTLVFQNGGALADEEGNPTFNTPEHLEALKFEQELVSTAAPPGTASYTFGDIPALYQQGKCAMIFNGGWFINQLRDEAPEVFENTSILPALKGRGPNAVQRIVGFYNPWMVYKQSEHPEEAMKFISFMMQPENLQKVYAYSGGGHGSVYGSLQEDPLYQAHPMTAELASQVEEFSVDYWYPNNAAAVGIGSMGTSIADIIVNPVIAGARTPEEALEDAQTQLSPLFEKQTP